MLGQIGPGARSGSRRALKQSAAGDKSEWVRYYAVDAYAAVEADRKKVVKVLVTALGDKSAEVRGLRARLLGNLGSKAAAAVPALMAALNDGGERTQQISADFSGHRPVRLTWPKPWGRSDAPLARAARSFRPWRPLTGRQEPSPPWRFAASTPRTPRPSAN